MMDWLIFNAVFKSDTSVMKYVLFMIQAYKSRAQDIIFVT